MDPADNPDGRPRRARLRALWPWAFSAVLHGALVLTLVEATPLLGGGGDSWLTVAVGPSPEPWVPAADADPIDVAPLAEPVDPMPSISPVVVEDPVPVEVPFDLEPPEERSAAWDSPLGTPASSVAHLAARRTTAPLLPQPTAGTQAPPATPALGSGPAGRRPAGVPVVLRRVDPTYPPSLRDARVEGLVVLHVLVGAGGGVEDVEVAASSGRAAFDDAAKDALGAWRFVPTGRPLWVRVPVRFRL